MTFNDNYYHQIIKYIVTSNHDNDDDNDKKVKSRYDVIIRTFQPTRVNHLWKFVSLVYQTGFFHSKPYSPVCICPTHLPQDETLGLYLSRLQLISIQSLSSWPVTAPKIKSQSAQLFTHSWGRRGGFIPFPKGISFFHQCCSAWIKRIHQPHKLFSPPSFTYIGKIT